MNTHVAAHAREFNRLRERLAADFGLDIDDEAVVDTAEGETNLEGLLVSMVRRARERAAQADVCAEQVKALMERKRRHVDAAEKLCGLVAETMIETGLRKLAPGDFTATASMTKPKPEIYSEDGLPEFYTRTVRKPDLDAIKNELARCQGEGEVFSIPGVTISNGRPSLTVRV